MSEYTPEKVAELVAEARGFARVWRENRMNADAIYTVVRTEGGEIVSRSVTASSLDAMADALTAISAERDELSIDEVRAERGTEEPEDPDAVFEYRVRNDVAGFLSEPMTLSGAQNEAKIDPHDFIEWRRKPDEWVPMEQGDDDA